jgi:hypothetical protein
MRRRNISQKHPIMQNSVAHPNFKELFRQYHKFTCHLAKIIVEKGERQEIRAYKRPLFKNGLMPKIFSVVCINR